MNARYSRKCSTIERYTPKKRASTPVSFTLTLLTLPCYSSFLYLFLFFILYKTAACTHYTHPRTHPHLKKGPRLFPCMDFLGTKFFATLFGQVFFSGNRQVS